MMQWDRLTLGRMAKELGFPRDTLEKVCRLADVLRFMESDELLSEGIALKGGTAINLAIFDLPRLSVDIDLDYCRSASKTSLTSALGLPETSATAVTNSVLFIYFSKIIETGLTYFTQSVERDIFLFAAFRCDSRT